MGRFTKIFLILTFFILFAPFNHAKAAIFSGSEVATEEGSEQVGLCLQKPEFANADEENQWNDACKDLDCSKAENKENTKCMTVAEYGTQKAQKALAGSGITHTATFGELVIKYVNFVLPYLTLAAFVGFVYAGFLYVTAYGNEEQLGKAKKILIWSVVGLVLVILSYTIVQVLTKALVARLAP